MTSVWCLIRLRRYLAYALLVIWVRRRRSMKELYWLMIGTVLKECTLLMTIVALLLLFWCLQTNTLRLVLLLHFITQRTSLASISTISHPFTNTYVLFLSGLILVLSWAVFSSHESVTGSRYCWHWFILWVGPGWW